MFNKKNMRLVVGSLVVASVLLSAWSMTSIVYAQSGSSAFDVPGSKILAGCKDPCTDYYITSVTECLDWAGPPCYKDRCTINNLRYLKCVESAGAGADDCEYHIDNGDWFRSVYVRWQACNSTTPATGKYGDNCSIDGLEHTGWSTPCIWNGSCAGELWLYKTYPGRARCGL